ncbi:MAG: CDP-alcohol phosphatidyltransferase family protein [Clostridia bacterium]|nr:CDP-alcohol phosphatidyltransferase family protein [Clostridia bacterium]
MNAKKIFTRKSVFTVPNLMSFARLLMIPLIVWLYRFRGEHLWAAGVLLLSGVTDVFDGKIARKFDQVSDLGKMLDPVADKLTQLAMLICIVPLHKTVIPLIVLFGIKELAMAVFGLIAIKKTGNVHSAQWYGKACTVFFAVAATVLILFPDLPHAAVGVIIMLCAVSFILSLTLYISYFIKLFKANKKTKA